MSNSALANVKVVDLTHYVAGPYCTKLMAGFGADVIKIEPPGAGDHMRRLGPFYENSENLESSIPFLWLNTGKKDITLNLKKEKGKDIFQRLIEIADVVVENFSPRVMPSLGLSYDALREINPQLVMVSISNFGQTGPYRDYRASEIQLQAMSGVHYLTGDPNKAPLSAGPALTQYVAGLNAYTAALLALFQRSNTREGQYIDVSIMECGLELIELPLTSYLHKGEIPRRAGHMFAPWDIYPCEDGYALVIGAPFRHWKTGASIFAEPRLLDEKYRHARDRQLHRKELESLIGPWLAVQKKEKVFRTGQEAKLAFGYLAQLDEVIQSPQHQSREFFVELDHPVTGSHSYCDAPFKMSATPWTANRAPLLGEHNHIVYRELLGISPEEILDLQEQDVI